MNYFIVKYQWKSKNNQIINDSDNLEADNENDAKIRTINSNKRIFNREIIITKIIPLF
jgi:hypothetical protein